MSLIIVPRHKATQHQVRAALALLRLRTLSAEAANQGKQVVGARRPGPEVVSILLTSTLTRAPFKLACDSAGVMPSQAHDSQEPQTRCMFRLPGRCRCVGAFCHYPYLYMCVPLRKHAQDMYLEPAEAVSAFAGLGIKVFARMPLGFAQILLSTCKSLKLET